VRAASAGGQGLIVRVSVAKLSRSTRYDRLGDMGLRIVANRSNMSGAGLYLFELFKLIMNGIIRGVWRNMWAPIKPM
jgi:hypothetical protein